MTRLPGKMVARDKLHKSKPAALGEDLVGNFADGDNFLTKIGNFDEIPDKHIKINPSNGIQITWPSGRVKRTNEEYRELVTEKMVELFHKWAEPLKVYETLKSNDQGTGAILHDQ